VTPRAAALISQMRVFQVITGDNVTGAPPACFTATRVSLLGHNP
jgi:hypothetical protein